ncbi:MAG TPA: type II toxin-antitoxin system RelE/ParE family toxin [Syntrophomonas sp.]|nr:type II toxin-antitoxin system RelE/ParE family toxin [Syntrophomonas sp.]HRW13238.1 type II toxin-antitoxin system RelE/ParE family toxin [Syntrophomonas sp.]
MSEWKVVYTEQAERDLRSIFEYIAFSLLEPEVAKNQSRRIMDMVAKLNQMPLRYPLYAKEPLQSKGLRVLSVDNYLAFYLPVETKTTVAIIRIIYGGRDIEEQLRQTEAEG